ncbi:MAG: hypothetical protein GTN67_07825 [Hydrotalea flava]|uniref:hypothetical protein n=1 Tax=Hydrotalea TaxID=1004300 RepID=UPI0010271AF3|nr:MULTISPECIES: hypothetical protein [Hydrotalea]NIM35289.1 hypothetical protein [Hydrotalea flava]NIM38148.1 hypothetical protein [Hydrotalea flava]NIN03312.1 hypothetical protein [Hydrotalea flava]NIN15006.1 hypothetical protein [Hydrotalea flava]NIO94074.1 hypothetical protein [Hydrotalea flava]
MSDLFIHTKAGVDIEEAKNMQLNNFHLNVQETKPVVYILNSSAIYFNKFEFNKNTQLLLEVQGGRTKNIVLKNTSLQNSIQVLKTGFGANKNVVQLN